MENWAQSPKFWEILIFFIPFESALPLRFQRALNVYSSVFKTQVMPILLFLTQNAQIWKIGPRPQILGNFEFVLFRLKVTRHYASNELSRTIHPFIKLKLCQFYCF